MEDPVMAASTARKIFVNLPVRDLKRSMDFFAKLGFRFDPQFTDEQAACMVVSDEAFVMLLVEQRFRDFTGKPISNATRSTEAILAVSAGSRTEVDELVKAAIAAGGAHALAPMDHGFMYGWSFYDPDGHHWEVMWMDPAHLAP
jgi:predicted lactoylglutathione lyase